MNIKTMLGNNQEPGRKSTGDYKTMKEREWALNDDKVEELYEYKNLGVLKNYCGSSIASNISDDTDT